MMFRWNVTKQETNCFHTHSGLLFHSATNFTWDTLIAKLNVCSIVLLRRLAPTPQLVKGYFIIIKIVRM